jgi:hypothetical protein
MRWLNDMWILHLDDNYWSQIAITNETKPKPRGINSQFSTKCYDRWICNGILQEPNDNNGWMGTTFQFVLSLMRFRLDKRKS